MKALALVLAFALSAFAGAPRYARWDWLEAASVAHLQEAGITHVLIKGAPPAEFAAACQKAGVAIVREAAPPGVQIVTQGKWPGLDPHIQTVGGEGATTSATGEPWVDSNAWLVLYHRAASGRPVLLSYDPPKNMRLRPGSLELAVADATVFGGQAALKLDDRLRQGLASSHPRVVAEWKRVARQLQFAETAAFRGATIANIAVVTSERMDKLDPVGEVMNLLARRNLPFDVVLRQNATPAALEKYALVIAVGQPPLGFQRPGLVERKEVPDPSAFAVEVRNLLGDRRPYQLTNSETVVSRLLRLEDGSTALHLVNYAIDPVRAVQARMRDKFSRAQLLAPDRDMPQDLPIQDGEFTVPELRISAVVILVR